MKVKKKATHMYYLLDDKDKYVHILSSQAWLTPVMLSERRSTRKCCQGFHSPPGFHSYLPALSQALLGLSVLPVLCSLLLFQPGSQLVWEVRGTSKNTDVVRDCSWHWMGWGKNIFTALFSSLAFLLCPHQDDSCRCALGKPCSLCHCVGCADWGMYSFL